MAILETTRKRRDYNGIAIKAHFGDWPPFCICPTKNFYSGAFLDTFQIAAKQLNLTYIIQPPLDENWNIWARRYFSELTSERSERVNFMKKCSKLICLF